MSEFILELECGHVVIERPDRSPTDGFCPRHRAHSPIVRRHGGYSVRCRGCRYTRRFGAAQLMANHAASLHSRKHPDHTVQVKLGDRVVTVLTEKIRQESLLDIPPF